jgi:hypothetical protein
VTTPPLAMRRRAALICVGLALAVAAVLTASPFELSRRCQGGAFSTDFGTGFDRPHCNLVLRSVGGDFEIRLPLQ